MTEEVIRSELQSTDLSDLQSTDFMSKEIYRAFARTLLCCKAEYLSLTIYLDIPSPAA